MKSHLIICLLALFVIAGLACEDEFMTQDSAVVTNDAGQMMQLTASPDNLNIAAGGAVTILIELSGVDGFPIQGGTVVVTSTLGTLGESSLTSDIDGIAITTLTAGPQPGYAVVVSTYKTMQAMVSVDFYEGNPGASSPGGENPDIGGGTYTGDDDVEGE